MDGEDSNVNKMSSTHPNLNPSDAIDSMSEEKLMRKNHFYILSLTSYDT